MNGGMTIIARILGIRPHVAFAVLILLCCEAASAQSWKPAPAFPGSGANAAVLRTDGTVLVEEITGPASGGGVTTGAWYLLVPDDNGNYSTGEWEQIASTTWGPLYFASAVLPDGRIVVEGGEYDLGNQDFSVTGAILSLQYSWTSIGPPHGWTTIGDAPSVILPNGQMMIGNCCTSQQALLNAKTLLWSSTGSGKLDNNSEEGWTLLPSGDVLTIDTTSIKTAELYHYKTGKWTQANKLPYEITFSCAPGLVPEIGPAVLRPDGSVFAAGANGKTLIYTSTGTWTKGPSFPVTNGQQFAVADGPAALLPNGHVLVMASSIEPCGATGTLFYSFDGTYLDGEPLPPNSGNEASFDGRMVVLPNGHVLLTDGSQDVEIYLPTGGPKSAWAPTITSSPANVTVGDTYTLKGTQFNGLSQGAAYGDDAQSASNFPLVRITNNATGHVRYQLTKNFSSGVATGSTIVSTQFEVTAGTETGASTLEVVTNGISSKSVKVTVH